MKPGQSELPLPGLGGKTLKQYVADNYTSHTDAEIAQVARSAGLIIAEYSVAQLRARMGLYKNEGRGRLPVPVVKFVPQIEARVPESKFARYDSPPSLSGNGLVVGDVEVPFQHSDFLNRCIELAAAWECNDYVCLGGDFVHHDSLSSFAPNWEPGEEGGISGEAADALLDAIGKMRDAGDKSAIQEILKTHGIATKRSSSSVSDEWSEARAVLGAMRDVFDCALLVLGNHEGRFLRAVDSPMDPTDFVRILEGEDWLKTAPYYFCNIESGGVNWRVTHPKNTSSDAAKVAAKLCSLHDTNVIQFHNHLWGMKQSDNGKYLGIESGVGLDPVRVPYAAQRDSTRPHWTNGATILRDGFAYLLHPKWTDWDRMAKL